MSALISLAIVALLLVVSLFFRLARLAVWGSLAGLAWFLYEVLTA